MLVEDIKKILMVGVGATATALENSKEYIDEMVEKGKLTVEQGKEMNEELKHSINKVFDKGPNKKSADSIIKSLDDLDSEELEAVKAKLNELENSKNDKDTQKA